MSTAVRTRAEQHANHRSLRVAMLVHGYYPWDERVKREAQALVDAGHEVDALCLTATVDTCTQESVEGVGVYRLKAGRAFTHSRLPYVFEYGTSFLGFSWRLITLMGRRRYDVVQVHTLPDMLVFATIPARLMGAKIVLDMHDLMPELYMSKFGLAEEGRAVRVLRLMERWATSYANRVITASEAFRDRLLSSGVPAHKVTVVLNTADPSVFPAPGDGRSAKGEDGFTVFWHGTMVRRYGLDLAIEAVALLRDTIPGLRFVIYGDGECAPEVREQTRVLGLEGIVEFRGSASHAELPAHISTADVGVVPNRPDGHIEMAYPTKLFEFVQMGIPVVATRTRVLGGLFDEGAVVFAEPTAQSIADGILWVHENPDEAEAVARRARECCEPVSWERMKGVYTAVIEGLGGS